MSRKADRKGTDRKGRSQGRESQPQARSAQGESGRASMGAQGLSGLQWPRQDGSFSGLGPASAGEEEEESRRSGWWQGGPAALCTAGDQPLTCHGPGALVLSPWPPLRLSTDNWEPLMAGRRVRGKPRWSPSQSEDSSAARPAGVAGRAACLGRNSAGAGLIYPLTHLFVEP